MMTVQYSTQGIHAWMNRLLWDFFPLRTTYNSSIETGNPVVHSLFSISPFSQVTCGLSVLPVSRNLLYKKVGDLTDSLWAQRSQCMKLIMEKQEDKLEMLFRHIPGEDKSLSRGHPIWTFSVICTGKFSSS